MSQITINNLVLSEWRDHTLERRPYWIRILNFDSDILNGYISIEKIMLSRKEYRFWFTGSPEFLEKAFKVYCPEYQNSQTRLLFDSFEHAKQYLDTFLIKMSKIGAFA